MTVSNQEVPRFCRSRHVAQCQCSSLTFAGFVVADVNVSCLECRTARPSTKSRLCHCFLAVSGANVLQFFTDMHRATPPLSCLVEILPQIGQVGLNDSGDDLQQCNDFVFRGRADFRCSICSKHFKAFLVPCCIWIYHPEGMDFLRLGSYFVIVVSWKKLFKNRDCGKRKTDQLQ